MPAQSTTVTCRFPGCQNPPEQPEPGQSGRPPSYCADPGHNRVTAWRERQRLAAEQSGVTLTDAQAAQPVTMARVSSAEMVRQAAAVARDLQTITAQFSTAVTTLGDPAAAEAEVESARAAAEQRAVTAEAGQADAQRRAVTASQLRAAADEAAEEMAAHLESARAHAEDARERMTQAASEHAAELERIAAEAQVRAAAPAHPSPAAIPPPHEAAAAAP